MSRLSTGLGSGLGHPGEAVARGLSSGPQCSMKAAGTEGCNRAAQAPPLGLDPHRLAAHLLLEPPETVTVLRGSAEGRSFPRKLHSEETSLHKSSEPLVLVRNRLFPLIYPSICPLHFNSLPQIYSLHQPASHPSTGAS